MEYWYRLATVNEGKERTSTWVKSQVAGEPRAMSGHHIDYSITSSARARQRRVTRQGKALGPGTVRACSGHLPAPMIQLMEATMPIDEYAKGGAHERAKDEAHE